MAITRHSNFDKTVNTINDRNLISNKVNGMMVVVLDAIADPNAGSGKAIYRWESSDASWILVSKSTTETMNFATEELTIINGEAQLSYIPVDNNVWNGVILNGQLIYADLNISAITISNGKISGLASEVNGMTLRVTYAYGTISQQITTAIEESIDTALAGNVKTINGVEIIGSGNIEVTAALPSMKTINNESILGTGNIQIVTDISGKADKSTTLNGYGITDAYTKLEVESKIVELSPPTDISMKADISYVDSAVSGIVGLAPSTLDTLKEIADQLVTDEDAVATLTSIVNNKVDKIPGKGLSTEDYTTAEKTKLAGIESGAQVNTVSSVSGKTGAITLTSSDVGLGNVNNTSDANKPVSIATQTALDNKADKATSLLGYGISDSYTKTQVDASLLLKADKVYVDSSDTTTLNSAKDYTDSVITSLKGLAPSTLDTIGELAAKMQEDETAASALVITVGTKVDKVAGKQLSTEDYTTAEKSKLSNIEAGAQVNTVASVAGKTGAVTLSKSDVGLSNVDNTSDASKPVSTATQTALDNKVDKVSGKGLSTEDYTTAEKTKLAGIEVNANNYVLPVATSTILGGVKAGTNISIDSNGVISANDTSVAWSEITSKPTTLNGYGITDAYTKTETDSAINTSINNLINDAPAALNTLKEIADQLANDESAVSALTTLVGSKANSSDVYTKTEIDNKAPNIGSSEFNTGMKRGTKIVYGIEIDGGLLTNATTKDIAFTFNASYTYWVDAQNSYASNSAEVLPLPYSSVGIGESIGVKLDLTNNKIKITSGIDRTTLSAKIVILYTK